VVEIQSHSGYIVLDRIFQTVLNAGARIAENGEFTRRAFLNGRIDLTQAEAVCDIIHAKSSAALQLAARQLTGRLKDRLCQIRNHLNELLVSIEAAIDFPEDAAELMDDGHMRTLLKETVAAALQEMTRHYRQTRYFKEGIRMAVVGCPNVGKSSLLNCLIKKDRAIVSAIPGTTRDFIEESFDMEGLPVTMVDTAGVQEASEVIEKLGIEKTAACIDEADLILFLLDLARPVDVDDEKVYEKIKNKAHIVVQNKMDLIPNNRIPALPNSWQKSPAIAVSALYGTHVRALKKLIRSVVVGHQGITLENPVVTNARQKQLLEDSLQSVFRAIEGIEAGAPAEIIAIDIKACIQSIDAVSGRVYTEDILDQIFHKFCVGK
jgi:tRNA modification GTPase